MGDEKREPESKAGHHWSAWEGGRRICMRCDKVESMTSEQWDEHLAAREPERKGASPAEPLSKCCVCCDCECGAPEMAAMLRGLEFCMGGNECPECGGSEYGLKHAPDCPLSALLDRVGR